MRTRLLTLALLLPLAAQAHMPWLLPNSTVVSQRDGLVTVDAAISEDLFVFERALELDQLRITGPHGLSLQPEARSAARHRSSFELHLPEEGSYRISHLSRNLLVSYRLDGKLQRLRSSPQTLDRDLPPSAELTGLTETRSRQQTFVSRETPGRIDFAPEGEGLEFLPLDPVTDLSAGDSSRLRVLLDGQPQPGATVTVRMAGNRYRYKSGEQTLQADAQGIVTVPWREAGAYWVGCNIAGPSAPGQTAGTREAPLRRAALSATFEVLPR